MDATTTKPTIPTPAQLVEDATEAGILPKTDSCSFHYVISPGFGLLHYRAERAVNFARFLHESGLEWPRDDEGKYATYGSPLYFEHNGLHVPVYPDDLPEFLSTRWHKRQEDHLRFIGRG